MACTDPEIVTMPSGNKLDRWTDAVEQARSALNDFESAMGELLTVQKECDESFGNMSEG